jgi:hypothetical protein
VAANVYTVTFRAHDEKRPSKFIVLADGRKKAIDMACNIAVEHIKPPPKSLNEILAQVRADGNGNGLVMQVQTFNRGSINRPDRPRS